MSIYSCLTFPIWRIFHSSWELPKWTTPASVCSTHPQQRGHQTWLCQVHAPYGGTIILERQMWEDLSLGEQHSHCTGGREQAVVGCILLDGGPTPTMVMTCLLSHVLSLPMNSTNYSMSSPASVHQSPHMPFATLQNYDRAKAGDTHHIYQMPSSTLVLWRHSDRGKQSPPLKELHFNLNAENTT